MQGNLFRSCKKTESKHASNVIAIYKHTNRFKTIKHASNIAFELARKQDVENTSKRRQTSSYSMINFVCNILGQHISRSNWIMQKTSSTSLQIDEFNKICQTIYLWIVLIYKPFELHRPEWSQMKDYFKKFFSLL